MKENKKWHQVRVDDDTHKELERLSKARKPKKKPMAQIIRERVFQSEVKTTDMVAIRQIVEANFATRRDLSRVTANINQLARANNEKKTEDDKIIERDRLLRAELLATLKDELRYSKEIHALCLKILGKEG